MLPSNLIGQHFFRITAEFSIKENLADGTNQLIMGKVYYDKNFKKLVYDIRFPDPQIWVMKDTFVYNITSEQTEVTTLPTFTEFSIFHLALEGSFHDFGIDRDYYQIGNVVRENDMVITTWHIRPDLQDLIGDIVISQKDRKIHGIAFFDAEKVLMSKQFYRNYTNVRGLEFPQEIVQIFYTEEKDLYKITTFKNIKVNDLQNNSMYNYNISDL